MGEKYHYARICEAALVAELAHVASEAVATCKPGPLDAFLVRHHERQTAIDAFLVPLDAARVAEAREELARAPVRLSDDARALLDLTDPAKLPAVVAGTAQAALVRHLGRFVRLLTLRQASDQVALEADRARVAVTSLLAADLSARMTAAGLVEESYEGTLVLRCLDLCAIPGRDHDVGVGGHAFETFIAGADLVARPFISEDQEPSPELFARVLARNGSYSAPEAWELFREDWMRFAGSFTGYSGPVWATGKELVESAQRVQDAANNEWPEEDDDFSRDEVPEEARPAYEAFRDVLVSAAADGHAVVEWVEKF